MNRRKRGRITVQSQPTKETRLVTKAMMIPFLIISVFFVIIGVTEIIPNTGMFGVVWTLVAISFVCIGIFNMVRKNGLAHRVGYDVENGLEEEAIVGLIEDVDSQFSSEQESTKARLETLQELYDSHLITTEEYEEKRQAILQEL